MKTRQKERPATPTRSVAAIQADFDRALNDLTDGITALEAMLFDGDIRDTFRASLANQDGNNR